MKYTPMIFNTMMTRALLRDEKTVTRRILKPQPNGYAAWLRADVIKSGIHHMFEDGTLVKQPWQEGDIIWVRETFRELPVLPDGRSSGDRTFVYYKADDQIVPPENWLDHWTPSIHMPKCLARIFLKVTDVDWGRLNSITTPEIIREGIDLPNNGDYDGDMHRTWTALWDSTMKKRDLPKYGYDANPWVWRIEFERVDKPNDWPVPYTEYLGG